MSEEEIKSRHSKELKALEGEKRAQLKKAKGTAGKGQKAKDILAALEADYDEKIKHLRDKHADELAQVGTGNEPTTTTVKDSILTEEIELVEEELDSKISKAEKARRKREKAREKERQREKEIEEETANAGPSQKTLEIEILMQRLEPLGLTIRDVEADGHCLFRAVANECGKDFKEIRRVCADALKQNEDDFAPFCEYTDSVTSFGQYVERVRSSADWGGHLELRALSMALGRPIIVYQALTAEPLRIDCPNNNQDSPIRLSYHRHYYALGEHYNQVVDK